MKKNEIIKALLETQNYILETVSKTISRRRKKKKEVSPTGNEIIEETQ